MLGGSWKGFRSRCEGFNETELHFKEDQEKTGDRTKHSSEYDGYWEKKDELLIQIFDFC